MKVEHIIDKKSRLVEKYHFPALTEVIALQKKEWYGWKTMSWIHPMNIDDKNKNTVAEYLKWKELKHNPSLSNNQKIKDNMIKKYNHDKI